MLETAVSKNYFWHELEPGRTVVKTNCQNPAQVPEGLGTAGDETKWKLIQQREPMYQEQWRRKWVCTFYTENTINLIRRVKGNWNCCRILALTTHSVVFIFLFSVRALGWTAPRTPHPPISSLSIGLVPAKTLLSRTNSKRTSELPVRNHSIIVCNRGNTDPTAN